MVGGPPRLEVCVPGDGLPSLLLCKRDVGPLYASEDLTFVLT